MPSFISIRPTVWPQLTNVTDRQTARTSSIGRTALQTVAQKLNEFFQSYDHKCRLLPRFYESQCRNSSRLLLEVT